MKILIFGDSHSIYFNLTNELKEINESFAGVDIKVVKITAATILGFGRRESTLNSRQVFLDECTSFQPDYIVFALGQVDVELGLYYRKVVKKEDIVLNNYFQQLCCTYFSTIENVIDDLGLDKNQVIIKGINLSVLTKSRNKAINYTSKIITENITNKNEIIAFKKHLQQTLPSNFERYVIHNQFNEALKTEAIKNYKYFDINAEIEDPNKVGQCKSVFIPAYTDHHLLDSLYLRELSINKLLTTIFNI